jgi:hypothetical protein
MYVKKLIDINCQCKNNFYIVIQLYSLNHHIFFNLVITILKVIDKIDCDWLMVENILY